MKYATFHIMLDETPPYFIGSQLRGALGYALKRTTCPYLLESNSESSPKLSESGSDSKSQSPTTPLLHTPCTTCEKQKQCVYYAFYEEEGYHPYRFDFGLGMPRYEFSLHIFEGALVFLKEIAQALVFMLTAQGLGGRCFSSFEIALNHKPLHAYKDTLPDPMLFTPPTQVEEFYRLTFITPLRIKKHNRLLKSFDLELKDMLHSIYQRSHALGTSSKPYPHTIRGEILHKELSFRELTRKSNRQGSLMNLGGLMGEMILKGLDLKSYEMLRLGEIIGAGKQCVFGLGKFTLEALHE